MRWHPFMQWIRTGDVVSLARAMSSSGSRDIAPVLVTENSSTTDGTSFATASVTPAANTLHILLMESSHATAAEAPSSVTGNGLTWNAVTNGSAANATGVRRVSARYAFGTAPSTGAITMNFSGTMTGLAWSLIALPGGKLGDPRQATSNTASSTTITGTLAALASPASVHLYGLGRQLNEASNPPGTGGWAELSDRVFATPGGALQVAWAKGDLTADPTWTTSGAAVIVSMEIQPA